MCTRARVQLRILNMRKRAHSHTVSVGARVIVGASASARTQCVCATEGYSRAQFYTVTPPVVRSICVLVFPPREVIFEEGDIASGMYLLINGRVSIEQAPTPHPPPPPPPPTPNSRSNSTPYAHTHKFRLQVCARVGAYHIVHECHFGIRACA
jgi:hypothetical protein